MISNIKKIADSKELSVLQLSKKTGLSRTTITGLMKDNLLPDKTRIETLKKVSNALNVPISQLVQEQPYIFTYKSLQYIGKSISQNSKIPHFEEIFLLSLNVQTETSPLETYFLVKLRNTPDDPDDAEQKINSFKDARDTEQLKYHSFNVEAESENESSENKLALTRFLLSEGVTFTVFAISLYALTKNDFVELFSKAPQMNTEEYNSEKYLTLNRQTQQYFKNFKEVTLRLINELAAFEIKFGKAPLISWSGNSETNYEAIEAFQKIPNLNKTEKLEIINPYSISGLSEAVFIVNDYN